MRRFVLRVFHARNGGRIRSDACARGGCARVAAAVGVVPTLYPCSVHAKTRVCAACVRGVCVCGVCVRGVCAWCVCARGAAVDVVPSHYPCSIYATTRVCAACVRARSMCVVRVRARRGGCPTLFDPCSIYAVTCVCAACMCARRVRARRVCARVAAAVDVVGRGFQDGAAGRAGPALGPAV